MRNQMLMFLLQRNKIFSVVLLCLSFGIANAQDNSPKAANDCITEQPHSVVQVSKKTATQPPAFLNDDPVVQPRKPGKKGAIIGTILGGVAGFALGVGLDLNDNFFEANALYYLAGTVGGALGGYLIGHQLDKHAAKSKSEEMKQISEEAAALRNAEFVDLLGKTRLKETESVSISAK